jgi:hypothetical protein
MTLHGRCVINDAHDSPLSFAGAGTFLAFSGDGIYRNRGACDMKPTAGPVPAGKYWIVKRPAGGPDRTLMPVFGIVTTMS